MADGTGPDAFTIQETTMTDINTTAPEAAGYAIVQEGYSLFGVGKSEAAAWADAKPWVGKGEDGKPSFSGLICRRASKALIDAVKSDGAPETWGTVEGVLCTIAEEEAYEG